MPHPDYHDFEEYQNRLKKLEEIKQLKIDPYPHKYEPTHLSINKIIEEFKETSLGKSEDALNNNTPVVKAAGRLILFRAMGKNAFAQIQDSTSKIQIMINRDVTEVEGYQDIEVKPIKFIEKKIDLGDIIGVEGNLFFTQKGELTIFVKKLTLLCKSLLPLPDKHSGIADKGVKYRKRWIDLIANEDSRDVLIMRSKIMKIIRSYFDENNFMEVETPILQNIYGGAEARPFKTELNALHQEMFLRIALEISLKKLIVGGLLKIYEIGKVFRNEGLDKTHNPEFTLLEAYSAYWDYNDLMVFIENLFEKVAITLFNDTKIQIDEHVIELKAPWKRISMKDSLKEYANIDFDKLSDKEIKDLLLKKDLDPIEMDKVSRGKLMALLFEEYVEEKLIQPHHITDHPIETTPLCKLHRDPEQKKQNIVERFETFILGNEFTNAYSELNDPLLQRKLLEEQAKQKRQGLKKQIR